MHYLFHPAFLYQLTSPPSRPTRGSLGITEELISRAKAYFSYLPMERREEAIAETVARAVAWTISAARRGTLYRVTAYWLVIYSAQQLRAGRWFAGTSSKCVMSEAARIKRGIRIGSLDEVICVDDGRPLTLHECLAGDDGENPFDIVRREQDYADIFEKESVSTKAAATFQFLADTNGEGRQCDLAKELGVSEGRITQLKDEVGVALGEARLRRAAGATAISTDCMTSITQTPWILRLDFCIYPTPL